MVFTHDLIFRIVNIIVACFMIIGGVATILTGGFPQFIRGIYCIVFGVMVFVFEFRLPRMVVQHVSYMFSFLGRGLFYIFIGCIILNYMPLAIASGVIVALCGVAFVIFQFLPQIEPPSNMRREAMDDTMGSTNRWDNDQSYGQSAANTGHTAGPDNVTGAV